MFRFLRLFAQALRYRVERMRLYYALIRNCPGEYGFHLRQRLLRKWLGAVGDNLKVHEGFRFRNIDKVKLGDNVNIGVDCFIQAGGGVTIGNYVILGPAVKIWTQNHTSEQTDIPIIEQGYEYREVVIGDGVWIGANAFLMPGAELGEGVIVSAGAVVGAKKIPPYKILAGNPARVIGSRIKEPKPAESE